MAEHTHAWVGAKNMQAGLALVDTPKTITACLTCGVWDMSDPVMVAEMRRRMEETDRD